MKRFTLILVIVIVTTLVIPLNAQLKDWDTKFGIRGSFIFPENEFTNLGFLGNNDFTFEWYKFSWLGEAFLGIRFTKVFELQLALGYGTYAGKAYFDNPDESYGEYNTTIIPADMIFRISPWDNPDWNPYFYFGGGILAYSINTKPSESVSDEPIDDDVTTGIIPLGIGAEFILAENILFDLSVGGALTTSYQVDGSISNADDVWDSYFGIGLGLTLLSESCDSDRDNDKFGRCDEKKTGTDPKNPDTDGDGLLDGEEYFNYNTNPLVVDTDGDSLSDFDEVINYNTNPLIGDSDNDQLSDGVEVLNYKTDPLKSDTDSDDLTDGDEILIYKANPLRSDTDSDGLSDGGEILSFQTNPLNIDTDGEGLSDGDEIVKFKTDPNNIDTDEGSVDDFTEVEQETNPLNPKDDIIKVNVPIVLEGITFATGKSEITKESEEILQGALETMQMYSEMFVEISGHTDNVGNSAFNKTLSQKRADSVRFWLIEKGIEPVRIIAKGYGDEFPRVPNDTPENRQMNRRIEFMRIR